MTPRRLTDFAPSCAHPAAPGMAAACAPPAVVHTIHTLMTVISPEIVIGFRTLDWANA
jgi:hypothetical protein